MRMLRLALIASLLAPLGIVATTTPADAELICRTYYYWSGSRRCWRRTCWRVPDRREHYAIQAPSYRYWNDSNHGGTRFSGYDQDDTDDNYTDEQGSENSDRNLFDEVTNSRTGYDRTQPWKGPNREWWDDSEPAPKRYTPQPASRPVDPEQVIAGFFVLCVVAAVFLLVRFIAWLSAIDRQRRLDKIERRVLSARTLTDRLQKDAREADALIRAYSREAYRRGTSS